jgi:uncharacterized protein YdhG (YjbR/CyaY superfamily)
MSKKRKTMEKAGAVAKSVDEYISRFPATVRAKLQQLRRVIRAAAPGAKETISYQIPAFMQNGPLVYFAAYENHIGFYPTSSGISNFKHELAEYKSGRGSVRFPMDKPLPFGLVGRIVKFRVAENIR